jgi:nitrile hydratase accessory protein
VPQRGNPKPRAGLFKIRIARAGGAEFPWESRIFGLTMSLHRAGLFECDEFRRLLIAEIRRWEGEHQPAEQWSYYGRWQAAFEQLLGTKNLCGPNELRERMRTLAARPAGHDH